MMARCELIGACVSALDRNVVSTSDVPISVLIAVIAVALAIVAMMAWLWQRARRRASDGGAPHPTPVALPSVTEPTPRTVADEDALVLDLIAIDDALLGDGLARTRTRRALERLGVLPLGTEEGQTFDAALHSAADRVPTTDREQHLRVAAVVRDGWTREERLVRAADVTVWAHE